jgi:hypothetical protein
MGFYSLVVLGFAPVGNLLVGWVAEISGVAVAVGLGGVVCMAVTLLGTGRLVQLTEVGKEGRGDGGN